MKQLRLVQSQLLAIAKQPVQLVFKIKVQCDQGVVFVIELLELSGKVITQCGQLTLVALEIVTDLFQRSDVP